VSAVSSPDFPSFLPPSLLYCLLPPTHLGVLDAKTEDIGEENDSSRLLSVPGRGRSRNVGLESSELDHRSFGLPVKPFHVSSISIEPERGINLKRSSRDEEISHSLVSLQAAIRDTVLLRSGKGLR